MGRDVRITSNMHARLIGLVEDNNFDDVIDEILREALDARSPRRLEEHNLRARLSDLYRDLLYTLDRMPDGGQVTSVFARRKAMFGNIAMRIGDIHMMLEVYEQRYREPVFDIRAVGYALDENNGMVDLIEEVRHLTEAIEAGISVSIEKE